MEVASPPALLRGGERDGCKEEGALRVVPQQLAAKKGVVLSHLAL